MDKVMSLIREPIIVVAGHVDHGKTSLLDAIRGSNLALKEAGRITQHIGATEIPIETIKTIASDLLNKYKFDIKLKGLLFIDTPGHEAFFTLRERGCKLANMAVLIIDIKQGIQPQTLEVIDYLKKNKTPFIVALTKLDTIAGFNEKLSLEDLMKEADESKTLFAKEFNNYFYKILGSLYDLGFKVERFDRIRDFTKEIIMLPISSKTKHGLKYLLLFLAALSQKYLGKDLELSDNAKAYVLELKESKGYGKVMDVILYDGVLRKNDYICVKSDSINVFTKIRNILKPKALQDIMDKPSFESIDEAYAAAGIRIIAPNIDAVKPGFIIEKSSEKKIACIDKSIERKKGVILKADTQGSLEALESLLKKESLDIAYKSIGPLSKEDIIYASLSKDFRTRAILCFNVKNNKEMLNFANERGVKVFSSNVVYSIIEDYKKWRDEELNKRKNALIKQYGSPVVFKIFPEYIFKRSKPLICGVKVLKGTLYPQTELAYASKKVGVVKQIQDKGKSIPFAQEGSEVAVAIDGANADKIDLSKEIVSYFRRDVFNKFKEYLNDKELIQKIEEVIDSFEGD